MSLSNRAFEVTPGTPLVIEAGEYSSRQLMVEVFPGDGDVQIQLKRLSDDAWYTPTAAEYTISTEGVVTVDRENGPEMRIIATGSTTIARVRGTAP